jgi:hypothetical protein
MLLKGFPNTVTSVSIVDDFLVVIGLAEVPNVVLVNTMINDGSVGVRWVSVNRLSLEVKPLQLLICVLCRDNAGGSYDGFFLGHKRLQTLEVVCSL